MAGDFPGAEAFLPPPGSRGLSQLRSAAVKCRGCNLYQHANQTVFGEGPRSAGIMFVGEQPGSVEDVTGRPFVGPAGTLLGRAMGSAGIARESVYLTNAVKHFKWTPAPRGKRRIHAKPTVGQMQACRPWLEAEIRAIRPGVIVLLGATAVRSVLGADYQLSVIRGKALPYPPASATVLATVHPAAILRVREESERAKGFEELVRDLRVASESIRAETLAGSS